MSVLATIVLCFTALQFLVALMNLLFAPRLKAGGEAFQGLVSVLIPARNEEENLRNLLSDLQNQEVQHIEVLVFDDLSTDGTAEVVAAFAAHDTRFRLIHSDGLPAGWLGKNYGCHCLSQQAKGEYLLFLDADVRVKNGIIRRAVNLAQKRRLGLLSLFPRQRMGSAGEWAAVPVMNFILLTLLPLALVHRSKFVSLSAANGQFMLFEASRYFETKPHEQFSNNKVEDIAIARYFKQKRIPVICTVGDHSLECRMYPGFREAVNGFSKNVISFFGNSFLLALLFWLITTLGFLAVSFAFPVSYLVAYIATVILTRILVSVTSRQPAGLNILFLIPQQISLGIVIFRAFINRIKKEYTWKGRTFS
ncbi:MAG TPA: glycosyltransferase family 2 protein [Prolixibacteraceae bacterium]|nr:glycosyltransferase family 2 protein [Prolixibacteraceae bacterium]